MPGVLTKKQHWRRQPLSVRRKKHDFIYREGFAQDFRSTSSARSLSEHSISSHPHPMLSASGKFATTGNLQDHNKHDIYGNKLKSVMFSAKVNVILIPSIEEYEAAGLANYLWWCDDDYKDFKQSALQEVKDFMVLRSLNDSKEAIKALYQDMNSNDLERIVQEEDKKQLEFKYQQLLFEKAKQEKLIKNEGRNEPSSKLNLDNSLQPSMESKAGDESAEIVEFENEIEKKESQLFDSLKAAKGIAIERNLSSTIEENTMKQEEQEPEITSFSSKTDVDIIHDKCSELESQELLAKLRKLHHDEKVQQTPNPAPSEGQQVHPLALICS